MSKLRLWDQHSKWEEAESAWEQRAREAAQVQPVKKLKQLPSMPGIADNEAKNLKWKSLKWMIAKDHQKKIFKGYMKHPLRYGWRLLCSWMQKRPYLRDGDFFLYNLKN